jgi:hypothetical protein
VKTIEVARCWKLPAGTKAKAWALADEPISSKLVNTFLELALALLKVCSALRPPKFNRGSSCAGSAIGGADRWHDPSGYGRALPFEGQMKLSQVGAGDRARARYQ